MIFASISTSRFLFGYGTETVLKRLVGRADVEDVLRRLDTFTKEETLILTLIL